MSRRIAKGFVNIGRETSVSRGRRRALPFIELRCAYPSDEVQKQLPVSDAARVKLQCVVAPKGALLDAQQVHQHPVDVDESHAPLEGGWRGVPTTLRGTSWMGAQQGGEVTHKPAGASGCRSGLLGPHRLHATHCRNPIAAFDSIQ